MLIIPFIPYTARTRPLLVMWLLLFIGVGIGTIVIMERMPVEETSYGKYLMILLLFSVFSAMVTYKIFDGTYRHLVIDHEGIRERQLFKPERGINWKDVYETHTRPGFIAFRKMHKKDLFQIDMEINYKEKMQAIIESMPEYIRVHVDLSMMQKRNYKGSGEYKAIRYVNICIALYVTLYCGFVAAYYPLTRRLATLLGEGANLLEYLPVMASWGVLSFLYTVLFVIAHRHLMPHINQNLTDIWRWVRVGEEEKEKENAPTPPK